MARYGGDISPESYGLRLTVEAPDNTDATTPVEIGDLFKLGGVDADGGGYKLVDAVAAETGTDAVLVQATERATKVKPIGVKIISAGYSRIDVLPYDVADAPAIGESVEIAASVRKVRGIAWAAGSFVFRVDTDAETCEVLH